MTSSMHVKTLLIPLLAMVGSSAALAECVQEDEAAGTALCESERQPLADSEPSEGAPARASYTWEDLLEAIPELREYQLGYRRNDVSADDQQNYLVCRKFKVTWTRIPQRECMPFREFIVYTAAQRRRAEQTRINIQLLPGPTPPLTGN